MAIWYVVPRTVLEIRTEDVPDAYPATPWTDGVAIAVETDAEATQLLNYLGLEDVQFVIQEDNTKRVHGAPIVQAERWAAPKPAKPAESETDRLDRHRKEYIRLAESSKAQKKQEISKAHNVALAEIDKLTEQLADRYRQAADYEQELLLWGTVADTRAGEQFDAIAKMDGIEQLDLVGGVLTLLTGTIAIEECPIGEFEIKIDIARRNLSSVRNLRPVHNGYYHHPHITGTMTTGRVCWGNFWATIADQLAHYQFAEATASVLAFLQTFNKTDQGYINAMEQFRVRQKAGEAEKKAPAATRRRTATAAKVGTTTTTTPTVPRRRRQLVRATAEPVGAVAAPAIENLVEEYTAAYEEVLAR